MSCEGKWRAEADLLQFATGLAGASVDAAPRCKHVDCRRPLKKDGTCPRGCPQNSTAPERPAAVPQLAALECAIAALEQRPKHLQSWQVPDFEALARRARAIIAQPLAMPQDNEEAFLEVLDIATRLFNMAYTREETHLQKQEWDGDARFPVARAAAMDILAGRAEALLDMEPPNLGAAWELLYDTLAHARHFPGFLRDRQERAEAMLRRIIPLDTDDACTALTNYLTQRTGFTFDAYFQANPPPEFRIVPYETSQRRGEAYNNEFCSPAREALLTLGFVPTGKRETASISLAQARIVVQEQVRQAQVAQQELDAAWQSFQEHVVEPRQRDPLPAPETLADWAQHYALPLWQRCANMALLLPTLRASVGRTGGVGQTETRLRQGSEEAAKLLQAVPPRLLPRVLSSLRLPSRVLDLLKFRAVRREVFALDMDPLRTLPITAPRAVAGLRLCEQVEALETKRQEGTTLTWADVAAVATASHDLDRVLTPAGTTLSQPYLRRSIAVLVDALSEHVPPDRAPAKFATGYYASDPHSYAGGTRLVQAESKLEQLWHHIRDDTENFSTELLREQAVTHGMPYGRYARRNDIVAWFSASSRPQEQEAALDKAMRSLLVIGGRTVLAAADRTGTDRPYKRGERVRLLVDGVEQEGQITDCLLAPVYAPNSDRLAALTPSVQVTLDDTTTTVPIAQVQYVPKTRKGGGQP